MATLAAAMAAIHLPSLLSAPQRFDAMQWDRLTGAFSELRSRLEAAEVDTLVVVSDEHFNVLSPACYPSFGVVAAEQGYGPAESWLGLDRDSVQVSFSTELAEHVLGQGTREGFDLARIAGGRLNSCAQM